MVDTQCEYRVRYIHIVMVHTKKVQTIIAFTYMGHYDPDIGRFISADPHWNITNMIYGDPVSQKIGNNKEYSQKASELIKRQQIIQKNINALYLKQGMVSDEKVKEATRWMLGNLTKEEKQDVNDAIRDIKGISIEAVLQSGNLYVYCMNNPILYFDPSGEFSVREIISGITRHGINQIISRDGAGVPAKAILYALKHVIKVEIDWARQTIKVVGEGATVVISFLGKIVTAWKNGYDTVRRRGGI